MRAIDEIRRVAYDLRPPVLDGMGVVGAIREYAAVLGRPEGGTELTVTVEAPEDGWPVLPAAVEVATYRIVTEALTNVVRHSSATAVTVRLEPDGPVLRLEVLDNGINAGTVLGAGRGVDLGPRTDRGAGWRQRAPLRPHRRTGPRHAADRSGADHTVRSVR